MLFNWKENVLQRFHGTISFPRAKIADKEAAIALLRETISSSSTSSDPTPTLLREVSLMLFLMLFRGPRFRGPLFFLKKLRGGEYATPQTQGTLCRIRTTAISAIIASTTNTNKLCLPRFRPKQSACRLLISRTSQWQSVFIFHIYFHLLHISYLILLK